MDAQELENLKKSSSTKSQDTGEKTSEELERNLNPNEANNESLREVELKRQRVAEISKLVGSMIGVFLGTMIYSKTYQEYEGETWTESLMNGFIAAVSLGFGFLLGKIITPTNEAVSTNLENAAVEQTNVQQTLPFCT
ncbi:hypothetical protein BBB02_05125 [Wolbachia endosymbiont of Bemisia tabaci]|uniref:hypothetical protein n=1 Tax=Wolbachia endosymbiont of Bemisia tabaci TaxID=215173 RepID=UPI000FD18894|nr:hypothetical protein [Wolbachia endosymbiont of Bemisia tabaci]AZU37842.1 hypothetical protein BBB02_05125 [Wolbachia endosymbiont of Bemisia tabaci]